MLPGPEPEGAEQVVGWVQTQKAHHKNGSSASLRILRREDTPAQEQSTLRARQVYGTNRSRMTVPGANGF